MKRNVLLLLLGTIFLIGSAIRIVGLGSIPSGLVDDEADVGYDAYSLTKTGRDQWGQSWPLVSFRGFGDYRTPLYTYFAIPSIKTFGLTPFAVRLPSALFGSLTIVALFFLVEQLFQRKSYASTVGLLSSSVLAISPWHIGMSRIASGEVLGVFFVTLGLTLFLSARRKPIFFPLAGLFLGLSAYTYTAYIVFVPVLVVFTFLLYRKDFSKKSFNPLFVMGIIFLLLCLPFLLTNKSAGSVRLQQVNLTHDSGTLDLINAKRGACEKVFSDSACRFLVNKYYVFGEKFLTNFMYHFSPDLLGSSGSSTQYSILPKRGLLYLVEIPILLVALYSILHVDVIPGVLLVFFLLIAAVPDSATTAGHYARFFISLPAWQILIAYGIFTITRLKKFKSFILVVIILYIFEVTTFAVDYVSYFPRFYASFSHYGYKELIYQIENNKNQYDRIIVSGRVNDTKQYIFYLFYTKYDPALFQSNKGVEKTVEENGWVHVKKINFLEFAHSVPTTQELGKDNDLVIGAPSEFGKGFKPVFTVKDLKGEEIFVAYNTHQLYLMSGTETQ